MRETRFSFPRSEAQLLEDLEAIAGSDAETFRDYMDTLRTRRSRAADLLEGARVHSDGFTHRAVLFAIGEVADESSIAGLERELRDCPRHVREPAAPPTRPRECPFLSNGDLDPECAVAEAPDFFENTPADALFALDAFDAVVDRTPRADNGRRFFGTVRPLVATAHCHPAFVSAAAALYVARSADPVTAQRWVDSQLRDRPQLARVETVAVGDTPRRRAGR